MSPKISNSHHFKTSKWQPSIDDVEVDFDFLEIDEDFEVNEFDLNDGNIYESVEIEVLDLEDNDDFTLLNLPAIHFVDDAEVEVFGEEKINELICPSCKKLYQKEIYFKKHTEKCGEYI